MFVWLGVWSATYGVGRLSGSPAVVAAWSATPRDARLVNTVATFLIVIPALLTFRQLVRGPLKRLLLVAFWAALVIGVAGVASFLATGSSRTAYQFNNALAASVLVVLVVSIAVPGLWAKYLVAGNRRVLVAGTFGFAVEALYSNVTVPLGIWHWQMLDDLGFALLLLSLAYIALATVFTNERRLLAVENELEIARRIQLSILPRELPSTRGVRIAATYLPMTAVAGDFYEFPPDGLSRRAGRDSLPAHAVRSSFTKSGAAPRRPRRK